MSTSSAKNLLASFGPILGFLLATGILVWWSTRPNPDTLPLSERLTAAMEEAPVRLEMSRTSVASALLFCDAKTRKVGATFSFYKTDGRAPVSVVGNTACKEPGPLFQWADLRARTREAYDPAMLTAQIQALFTQANITENKEERYNYELGAALSEKYKEQYKQKPVGMVEFECEKKGEPLRYVATYRGGRVERGEVKTRCSRDYEEFVVMPAQPNPYRPNEMVRGEVHQYHKLPVAMVDSAYAEFLATPELKKSF